MKFPNFLMNRSLTARALVLLAGLFLLTLTVPAQKIPEAAANPGLEQCRNGAAATPQQCIGSAWVTGNANEQQSHYAETQYLPYRFTVDNAVVNSTYTVSIGYDIIKVTGGVAKHAIDFLGNFNNTEANANPCADKIVGGCNPASPDAILTIPPDTDAVPSTIVQPAGHFSLWGATPIGVATYNNYTAGDTHRTITLTFKATGPNVVIAWGGHVAWAGDWGAGNSAGGISGSPYHTNIDACVGLNGCGGLDVQLSASAVAPSGLVRVIKVASVISGVAITAFPFTTSSDFPPTNSFSIVDNNPDNNVNNGGVMQESGAITSFGAAHSITINEENIAGWTLNTLTCATNINGTVVSTDVPMQPSAHAGTAVVWVNPGGLVTCTFTNTQLGPTAAPATVTGRVLSSTGSPLSGITLTLTDLSTGEVKTATSTSFGYYTFSDLTVQDFYQLTVTSKRYRFSTPSRTFTLNTDLADMDFICTNQ